MTPHANTLGPLFAAGLFSGVPLSAAGARAAFEAAMSGDGHGAGATYSRPELNATQAAALWEQHAARIIWFDPNGPAAAQWAARRILRPENAPANLTDADVEAWPAPLAYDIAVLLRAPGTVVPPTPALSLMRARRLLTRVHAAAALPACDEALEVVAMVGRLGALDWPGMTLHMVAVGERQEELAEALHTIAGWATPAALKEHAALVWTSPACLSLLDAHALPAPAAGRVMRLWLLPAVRGRGGSLSEAAERSASIVGALDAADATELAGAWHGGLLDALPDEEKDLMIRAFKAVGVGLVRAMVDQPVSSVRSLSPTHRLELFTEVEGRTAAHPHLWTALAAALATPRPNTGTWGELLDALEAIGSPATRVFGNR